MTDKQRKLILYSALPAFGGGAGYAVAKYLVGIKSTAGLLTATGLGATGGLIGAGVMDELGNYPATPEEAPAGAKSETRVGAADIPGSSSTAFTPAPAASKPYTSEDGTSLAPDEKQFFMQSVQKKIEPLQAPNLVVESPDASKALVASAVGAAIGAKGTDYLAHEKAKQITHRAEKYTWDAPWEARIAEKENIIREAELKLAEVRASPKPSPMTEAALSTKIADAEKALKKIDIDMKNRKLPKFSPVPYHTQPLAGKKGVFAALGMLAPYMALWGFNKHYRIPEELESNGITQEDLDAYMKAYNK